MRYLTKTIETYRVATESEASVLIKEMKNDSRFEVAKYVTTKRQKKAKGEIVDEWYRVEITKLFNDENEPGTKIEIEYDVDNSFIPPEDDDEYEED